MDISDIFCPIVTRRFLSERNKILHG